MSLKSPVTILLICGLALQAGGQQFKHRKDTFYVNGKPYLVIRNQGTAIKKDVEISSKHGVRLLRMVQSNGRDPNSPLDVTMRDSGNLLQVAPNFGNPIVIGQILFGLNFLDPSYSILLRSGEEAFIKYFNDGQLTAEHTRRMDLVPYPDAPVRYQNPTIKPEGGVADAIQPKTAGMFTIIGSRNAKGTVKVNDEKLFEVTDAGTVVGKTYRLKKGDVWIHQDIVPIDPSMPHWVVYRLDKVTYDPEHWEFIDSDTLNKVSSSFSKAGVLDERGYEKRPNISTSRIKEASPAVQGRSGYQILAVRPDDVAVDVFVNDSEAISIPENGAFYYLNVRPYLVPGRNTMKVEISPKDVGKEYNVNVFIMQKLEFAPGDVAEEVLLTPMYREKGKQVKVLSFYVPYLD